MLQILKFKKIFIVELSLILITIEFDDITKHKITNTYYNFKTIQIFKEIMCKKMKLDKSYYLYLIF